MKRFNTILLSGAAVLLLAACGGGSTSLDIITPIHSTGVFVDGPVEGLNYSCSSGETGITDSSGEFTCYENDTVTFYLGTYELGSALMNNYISPVNLYPDNPRAALNVAQLLQTIDSDKKASNGIVVDSELIALLQDADVSCDDKYFDTAIVSYIEVELVSESKALLHLNNTLSALGEPLATVFRLSKIAESYGEDGIVDYATFITYDANGNMLTMSSDIDGDNIGASATYDANGNRLTEGIMDEFGDFSITTNTYDTNDNLLTKSIDYEGDGIPDESTIYTYDANDNKLTVSIDYEGDGTVDESFIYTYDANNNILTVSIDYEGDGTVDRNVIYTYDANDNFLTKSIDIDGDGIVDYIIMSATYDANGNMLIYSVDIDGDGTVDESLTRTYDANGNTLTVSIDYEGDGTVDESFIYTYDANDNILTESIIDEYGDFRITTNTYDANDNLLTESLDYEGDGTVEESFIYTYDANDNRLTETWGDEAYPVKTYTWIQIPA